MAAARLVIVGKDTYENLDLLLGPGKGKPREADRHYLPWKYRREVLLAERNNIKSIKRDPSAPSWNPRPATKREEMDVEVMMKLQPLIQEHASLEDSLTTSAWSGWWPRRKAKRKDQEQKLFSCAQDALVSKHPTEEYLEDHVGSIVAILDNLSQVEVGGTGLHGMSSGAASESMRFT